MLRFIALLLFSSCATQNFQRIKKEIAQKNISTQSVLDLGRSAYYKGCVDSKSKFRPSRIKMNCLEMAKKYEKDLIDILK